MRRRHMIAIRRYVTAKISITRFIDARYAMLRRAAMPRVLPLLYVDA